jgi:hypothetical protein
MVRFLVEEAGADVGILLKSCLGTPPGYWDEFVWNPKYDDPNYDDPKFPLEDTTVDRSSFEKRSADNRAQGKVAQRRGQLEVAEYFIREKCLLTEEHVLKMGLDLEQRRAEFSSTDT